MKKLLLLAWIIALTASVYGQEHDLVTNVPTLKKRELKEVAKAIGLNYKLPENILQLVNFL